MNTLSLRSGPRAMSTVFFAMLLSIASTALRADDLPISVQADVLKHQIADAIKANRDQDALASIDQYHQLEKRGAKIPPLILFIEAQVAKRSGATSRAYEALTAFLKVAHEGDPHYQDGIAMYSELGATAVVKAAKQRQQQELLHAAWQARVRREAHKDSDEFMTAFIAWQQYFHGPESKHEVPSEAEKAAGATALRRLLELERTIPVESARCDRLEQERVAKCAITDNNCFVNETHLMMCNRPTCSLLQEYRGLAENHSLWLGNSGSPKGITVTSFVVPCEK
jgi:hypothetical protein